MLIDLANFCHARGLSIKERRWTSEEERRGGSQLLRHFIITSVGGSVRYSSLTSSGGSSFATDGESMYSTAFGLGPGARVRTQVPETDVATPSGMIEPAPVSAITKHVVTLKLNETVADYEEDPDPSRQLSSDGKGEFGDCYLTPPLLRCSATQPVFYLVISRSIPLSLAHLSPCIFCVTHFIPFSYSRTPIPPICSPS